MVEDLYAFLPQSHPLATRKTLSFADMDGESFLNVIAQELASARVPLRYHRHSGRGEVDFIAETSERSVVPIEVKSGKTYKRHVALNNLLAVDDYGVSEAYVLSEANVSSGLRSGKPVHYLPLYLAPFVARRMVAEEIDTAEELARLGVGIESLIVPPPSFGDL